ncbi:MAG: patatin-like phospholipase family protein [Gammaproteobacteria bacterium]|nr:patatin-like phospholipase family protein [Gammaproteobacteria bacterium]
MKGAVIAVCLGSGGRHGYAHIGVIRALQRRGFVPDLIVGTSAGSIAGALWAAGHDADAIERVADLSGQFSRNRFRLPVLGIGTLDGLRELVDRHIGSRDMESLPIRFAAQATDLDTGAPVILASGPVGRAVVASASVPLRYEPVLIDGRRLVDGALSAPVPVDAARSLGADVVIAFDVAYRPYEEPVDGFSDVAFQTYHIMVNRLIEEQIRRADIAIRLDVHQFMDNEEDMQATMLAGEQAVHHYWPEISRLLTDQESNNLQP